MPVTRPRKRRRTLNKSLDRQRPRSNTRRATKTPYQAQKLDTPKELGRCIYSPPLALTTEKRTRIPGVTTFLLLSIIGLFISVAGFSVAWSTGKPLDLFIAFAVTPFAFFSIKELYSTWHQFRQVFVCKNGVGHHLFNRKGELIRTVTYAFNADTQVKEVFQHGGRVLPRTYNLVFYEKPRGVAKSVTQYTLSFSCEPSHAEYEETKTDKLIFHLAREAFEAYRSGG